MSSKYYGVRIGIIPGVYTTLASAVEQTQWVSGADFKGFNSEIEAINYVGEGIAKNRKKKYRKKKNKENKVFLYVDGSYIKNSVGSGIVIVKNSKIIFKDAARYEGNIEKKNVAGELYAVIRAIQFVNINKYENITIAYDFEGIKKWVTGEWEASINLTQEYVNYFKEFVIDKNIKYSFLKIKAHSGNKFNEEAHNLAKLGTLL